MKLVRFAFITTCVLGQAMSASAQTTSRCDRACLIKTADTYFAALAAHDPKKAPMAPMARFTEQAKALNVGDGLWKTMTAGPTTFKIYVPDPVSQQIGGIAMVKSEGKPTELALRLKVQNGQITEAEHIMATITADGQLANLQTPRPGLLAPVPASDRLPREILLLFAHGYYDALEQSDGHAVPFADDCVRRENGMQTAGPRPAGAAAAGTAPSAAAGGRAGGAPAAGGRGAGGGLPGATGPAQLCGPQLDTRTMSYIDSLDLRRVMIADPENGLVFGLSMFRHPMKDKTITILNPDGTKGQREVNFNPFDLEAAHIIKVQGNKIHDIEAMGFMLPLYSKNGWSEFTR
jgi:hypothetical protein